MPDNVPGTTERVLRLLSLLQQRPVWTGPELAERLGVTTRSIRRDVDRLRNLGYPVHAAQGLGGGYQLGRGKELPPLLLDDDEAVAIAVSLRLAAAGAVTGASEAALSTLAKLDQVMPPRLRSEVSAIHESTEMLGAGRDAIDGTALLVLAKACRDLVRVRFGYDARDGAASERWVEPVRLVATGYRWYLMAWDVDREDWRTFRLDRMRDVQPSTWRFTPREHPDPREYVQRSVSQAPYAFPARLVVHAPLAAVEERTSVRSATLTPLDDERTLMEVGAHSLHALAAHLAWIGFDFEVEEPAELREAAREMGERLLRAAGGST
ncbi:transcriptional regulator [Nocardioides gansuensis]|uniref:Transcriptional regulator n=1 Tax=Nocardioides gansuensis TaxID=2138300 RepID=A0A2T8FCE1_9ACTN|nr:YafY family protein [Nocardioides gansuensis]PVG83365.1 transcriptional regulator [Nocardioides gansuensis]